jgi:hypothetical protein
MGMQDAEWLQDADRLKKLIKEFDQLDKQSGAYRTPQKRG